MRSNLQLAVLLVVLAGLPVVPAFGQSPKSPKRGAPFVAGRALERWENMTPEQRQRALQRLSPERRAAVEERLRRLEQLPEADRQQLRQRYTEFRSLPEGRQDALRLELQALRNMRPVARRRRVNSPEFQRQYSDEEKRILRQALGLE